MKFPLEEMVQLGQSLGTKSLDTNRIFSLRDLSVAFANTGLKPLNDGSSLVSFTTPQAKQVPLPLENHAADVRLAVERISLGGGEARRVVVQQPWRVRDLVIPPIADSPAMTIRIPNQLRDVVALPSRMCISMRTPARPTLTEEERKTIQNAEGAL